MKLLNTLLASFALAGFIGCSGDKKETDSGPDCTSAPKLSKACVEGTWEMSKAVYANFATALADTNFVKNAYLPISVQDSSASYTIKFLVAKNHQDSLTALDSVVFTRTDSEGTETVGGHYAISSDGTAFVNVGFVPINWGPRDIGTAEASILDDSTGSVLVFPVNEVHFDNAVSDVSTVEMFYRAPTTKD
jgi:hypothetical protein